MIDHYEFGSITIDGKRYDHDVVIFKGGVRSWWRKTSHNVDPEDLEGLLKENPKKIIFGTGASGVMKVSEATQKLLNEKGIEFSILKTSEATKKFNELSSYPGVAAALHLTC